MLPRTSVHKVENRRKRGQERADGENKRRSAEAPGSRSLVRGLPPPAQDPHVRGQKLQGQGGELRGADEYAGRPEVEGGRGKVGVVARQFEERQGEAEEDIEGLLR